MLTIKSGLPCSMSKRAQILVGGLAVSLTIVATIMIFAATVAAARSSVESTGQIVDRAQKGDRLSLLSKPHLNALSQRRKNNVPRARTDSKLADGCEPIVSFLANSELARIAGRCVS